MAKTKRAMVAELARRFEAAGLIVRRGPFEIVDEGGEVRLIAESVIERGQMRLPLDDTPDGWGDGR